MKTMRTQRVVLPLALLSAAFMLGCSDQGLEPVGLDGVAPQFAKGGNNKGKPPKDGDDPTEPVTWSADARLHLKTSFVGGSPHILQSGTDQSSDEDCSGFPGSGPTNPSVEWNDEPDGETPGFPDGCAQVTTTYGTLLTNDANVLVATKKGSTEVTIQFQIQDVGGPEGIQYRTDKFVIDLGGAFTGAGFILHVDTLVEIWRLKGHTGGPKVESVGKIFIDDIVYR